MYDERRRLLSYEIGNSADRLGRSPGEVFVETGRFDLFQSEAAPEPLLLVVLNRRASAWERVNS